MNLIFQENHQRIFGSFPLRGDAAIAATSLALEVGYRHIDTANVYGNEAEVGTALASSGIPRDELVITTKVAPDNYANFMPTVHASLEKLQLDAVDILLLHWPPFDGSDIVPSLRLLEQAHSDGLAKHIGISNYTVALMRKAKETVSVDLVCNQVEFHPLLDQRTLLNATSEVGIPLTAYCSVARGKVFEQDLFGEIGATYGKTAGQVVLRWILQQGVAPITMSTKEVNLRANYDIMDFALSCVDMQRIYALTTLNHRVVDRKIVAGCPDWD